MFKLLKLPIEHEKYTYVRYEYMHLTIFNEQIPMPNNIFIGGMPLTLEKQNLKKLLQVNEKTGNLDYHMTLKVDGERYLLFLSGTGELYFIDRSLNIYIPYNLIGNDYSQLRLSENYPRFMLDGELVSYKKDNVEIFEYLVFDCLFAEDKNITKFTYYERYSQMNKIISGINVQSYFLISAKKWYSIKECMRDKVYEYIKSDTNSDRKKYNSLNADGLIFQVFNKEYIPWGSWSRYKNIQYKWKPIEQQTMDFIIMNGVKKGTWELHTKRQQVFRVPILNIKAECEPSDRQFKEIPAGTVGEFTYDKSSKKFKLKKIRPNKEANSLATIKSVMNCVLNPFDISLLKQPLKYLLENNESCKKDYLKLFSKEELMKCALKDTPYLFFNNSEYFEIEKLYKKIRNNTELEFRIFRKNKTSAVKNIDMDIFNTVFYYFSTFYKFTEDITYELIENTEDYSDYDPTKPEVMLKNVHRSIFRTFQDLVSRKKSILNEYKSLLQNIDSKIETSNNLSYRISLSEENKTTKISDVNYVIGSRLFDSSIRFKRRYSAIMGIFRLDLTIVKSTSFTTLQSKLEGKPDTYEIELELINKNVEFPEFINTAGIILMTILSLVDPMLLTTGKF